MLLAAVHAAMLTRCWLLWLLSTTTATPRASMRRYVITGGCGLLGQKIARHLVNSIPPSPAGAGGSGGGGGGVRVMIVDKGPLANESGGKAAAAAAATTASSADGSSSSSNSNGSRISCTGSGSVEASLKSIIGGGCGTMAGPGGGGGEGGGEPSSSSSSSVVIVRGDLTSTDIAAEIKSFAASSASSAVCATSSSSSSGGDGDAATSLLSIFHLASVMSGHAEKDFNEALRVNIEGKKEREY